ncbi:MAG TPA: flagellar basal body rod protein FlgB [Bradyrhizobium sp.]|jgi:flagellar basal-body rod protein FlgB|uniref:flagellar basal body rod protein FlgB n=1 Tax=Bradyrhizobium sp. TaxID=376 RepID=UPI002B5D3223|nr:flagellar basal body rod protein FlgB [Bradyrhizobium sp.]HXB76309.1 flagellar basal body rod protein FlgB [Bradyrhizobium sp.]
MSINDLPALSALRTRMQWHQERQRVLAENVSNSNTPNFKPRDLVELKFNEKGGNAAAPAGSLALLRTSQVHLSASGAEPTFDQNRRVGFQTRPAGNSVSLEEEMLKVSANQMDYAAATSLYGKSLHLLKMAIGKA